MPEPLTTQLVAEVLEKLMVALPRGKGYGTPQQVAETYRDGLSGISGDALRWAAKTAIQEDSYFPKVARLRDLANRWTKHNTVTPIPVTLHGRHCRGCNSSFVWTKRWRPRTTKPDGYGYPLTSADGVWLMLEEYSRDVCKCHQKCEYWPELDAPSREPAMRLLTVNGGANVPPYTLYRAASGNPRVGSLAENAAPQEAA